MSPALLEQLTLAILDHSADQGLRMIKTIRSYLDTWETFQQHRHQLVDHLRGAHHADPSCMEADPASLTDSTGRPMAATWPASWTPTPVQR